MYKLILGLLILIATLVIACGDDDDNEDADGDTSPTASGEATEDAASSTIAGDGDADGGTFSSSALPISVTVTPGEGFATEEEADIADLFAVFQSEFPNGYVDFLQPTEVYTYQTATDFTVSGPPDDYVTWFNEIPFPTIADTQDVTVGGLQGTRLEIMNADEEDFTIFELSDGSDYSIDYLGQNGAIYAYVIDVNGTQVLAICGTENASNFGEFASTCEEVVAAAEFGT